MGYQVLARKWRPKNFHQLVGQDHVSKALINALDSNRLHHAYLFTGTRGVGKTTLARILAKCFNCVEGVTSQPCGTCSACTAIDAGRFVDLIEVDAASRTKVEDTRELLDNVQYAPTQGRFKVYLIDEVHMLSGHSFNALLKTLEEPPAHVKFILATTDPQKLPVTVLSRCLQFQLKNMPPESVVEHLRFLLAEEKVTFEEPALWLLGKAADGSMRDALSLTDQAIAYGQGNLVAEQIAQMLGVLDHQHLFGLLQALVTHNPAQLMQQIALLAEQAPDFNALLQDLASLLHQLSLAQIVPEALPAETLNRAELLTLAASLPAEEVQLYYQLAIEGRRDLMLAPDPRTGLEMTLLRMLAFRPLGIPEVPHEPLVPVDSNASNNADHSAPPVNQTNFDAAHLTGTPAPKFSAPEPQNLPAEQLLQGQNASTVTSQTQTASQHNTAPLNQNQTLAAPNQVLEPSQALEPNQTAANIPPWQEQPKPQLAPETLWQPNTPASTTKVEPTASFTEAPTAPVVNTPPLVAAPLANNQTEPVPTLASLALQPASQLKATSQTEPAPQLQETAPINQTAQTAAHTNNFVPKAENNFSAPHEFSPSTAATTPETVTTTVTPLTEATTFTEKAPVTETTSIVETTPSAELSTAANNQTSNNQTANNQTSNNHTANNQTSANACRLHNNEDWLKVFTKLDIQGWAASQIRNLVLVSREQQHLNFAAPSQALAFLSEEIQQELRQQLQNLCQEEFSLNFAAQDNFELDNITQRRAKNKQQLLNSTLESLQANPHIQELQQLFQAELDPHQIVPLTEPANY